MLSPELSPELSPVFVQPFRVVGVTDLAVYGCEGTVHVVCRQRATVNALGCLCHRGS